MKNERSIKVTIADHEVIKDARLSKVDTTGDVCDDDFLDCIHVMFEVIEKGTNKSFIEIMDVIKKGRMQADIRREKLEGKKVGKN